MHLSSGPTPPPLRNNNSPGTLIISGSTGGHTNALPRATRRKREGTNTTYNKVGGGGKPIRCVHVQRPDIDKDTFSLHCGGDALLDKYSTVAKETFLKLALNNETKVVDKYIDSSDDGDDDDTFAAGMQSIQTTSRARDRSY